ncbi:hypothetical protein Tco_0217425 [Tanacetum coccineum]
MLGRVIARFSFILSIVKDEFYSRTDNAKDLDLSQCNTRVKFCHLRKASWGDENCRSKLVLLGDDEEPLKPLNVYGQANAMKSFPCLSDTFGTPNTFTKVTTADPNDIASNKGEGGSVNMIESAKSNALMCMESWGRSSFTRPMIDLRVDIELKDTLVVVVAKIEVKPMDTNSTTVCNINFGSKTMADMASPTGMKKNSRVANYNITKIMTSNLFDVLIMVENDVGAAPSDVVCSKGDMTYVNVGNNKDINLDNEDSVNDVIHDTNETSFLAPKLPKVASSSIGGAASGKSSLYERWKKTYDDNPYEDDECEYLTP